MGLDINQGGAASRLVPDEKRAPTAGRIGHARPASGSIINLSANTRAKPGAYTGGLVLPAVGQIHMEIDMDIINPRFLQARRRAARYGIGLECPAYVRKHLTPRVQIGSKRDPALPIEISPAIHTPQRVRFDRYDAVGVLALAGLVSLLFIGG